MATIVNHFYKERMTLHANVQKVIPPVYYSIINKEKKLVDKHE